MANDTIQISYIPYGETAVKQLTGPNIVLQRAHGLGLSDVEIKDNQLAQRSGSEINNVRLSHRIIGFDLYVISTTGTEQVNKIAELTRDLSVTDGRNIAQLSTFFITNYDGNVYLAKGGVIEGFEATPDNQTALSYSVRLRIYCPDPMFYAAAPTSSTHTFMYGVDYLADGFADGAAAGWGRPHCEININNDSTAPNNDYQITIHGPSANPWIYNYSDPIGSVMIFDGIIPSDVSLIIEGSESTGDGVANMKLSTGQSWNHILRPGTVPINLIPGNNNIIVLQDNFPDPINTIDVQYTKRYNTLGAL